VGELAHRPARQPRGAADGEQRLATGVPPPDLLVGGPPSRPAVGAGRRLGPRAGISAGAPRRPFALDRHSRQPPKPGVRPGQPAFDHPARVDQQVPAVGHLRRSGRSGRRAPGVLRRAIPDDGPDPRPAPQPPRQGRGGAIRQEVGDAPPLHVDQDGPVGAPPLERPIVDPQDAGRRTRRERQAPHEAQHRGGARRHGQVRREPRAGLAAERDPDPRLGLGQPPRAAGAGREQTRQALGEGAPRAVRGAAVEPAHAEAEAGLAAERG
jgi:hypothetical protein